MAENNVSGDAVERIRAVMRRYRRDLANPGEYKFVADRTALRDIGEIIGVPARPEDDTGHMITPGTAAP